MSGAARRVWGLMYRHLALYRRSWPRVLELMYWPVLQMLVWGFVTAWLAGAQNNTASVTAGVLLGGPHEKLDEFAQEAYTFGADMCYVMREVLGAPAQCHARGVGCGCALKLRHRAVSTSRW